MMETIDEDRSLNPASSILIFFASVFLGFAVIGPAIGFFVAIAFYEGNFMELVEEITSGQTSESIRIPYLIMQGCASAIGLIVIPMMAYRFIVKKQINKLVNSSPMLVFGLTAACVVAFVFPNSVIIEWNAGLDFSGPFWTWAKEKEALATKFTKFLLDFESSGGFPVLFILIAVIPAIGEEFCFRGWLQPAIQKATGNAHVAIWISAFMFSAIHVQFFSFVPRMLLGAMFGYLMLWTNNLWIPIFAHFINNGFMVVMMFLYQKKISGLDVESTDSMSMMYVTPFTILFVFLMMYLKKISQPSEEST